jgi:pimeloyl-ACP methyl ester carboxylesterase
MSSFIRRSQKWLIALGACLSIVVLSLSSSTLASASGTVTSPSPVKPTIVIEHGAWADGSSFSAVVRRLQTQGYTVDVPPNPLTSLAGDTATLADYLKTISGPIVLVGHSYGGMVISDAATGNAQVKGLVYVDAFIPAQGESAFQLTSAMPGSCLGGGGNPANVFNFVTYPKSPAKDAELYAKVAAGPSYPGFAKCFANDLSALEGAVLGSTQSPITLSALMDPSTAPAWTSIPSWALVGTQDQVIPEAEQLFMAHRAHSQIKEVSASHLSMISHPGAVADLINEAASASS